MKKLALALFHAPLFALRARLTEARRRRREGLCRYCGEVRAQDGVCYDCWKDLQW